MNDVCMLGIAQEMPRSPAQDPETEVVIAAIECG